MNYNVVMTDAGEVRVSPFEAMILRNSYTYAYGREPTPMAKAIMASVRKVAEWKSR